MHAIEELERRAAREIGAAPDTRGLKELEAKYLGKSGELTGLLKSLGSLPPDQKPAFGKALNEAKERLAQQLEQRERDLKAGERAEQFDRERIDITMPGRRPPVGREHILQLTMNKIKQVFAGLGFEYVETPELEKFKYNFDVLW